MTSDSSLHRPTESLVLPNKRRFFPFKIPNFHTQLRHYISTADPDRIYVIVERVVYAIHISAQKRESIAIIPFEPRCLVAGYGWIAVGGPENGECAFIRVGERGLQVHGDPFSHQSSDVDSALPLDLDPPSGLSSPGTFATSTSARRPGPRLPPEFELHKFGGSIVNSLTIHRFLGNEEGIADEDVIVLSNNDRTVTVYSLTRTKVLKVLHHPTCMNYAVISPDHSLLAAVGDENRAYFYTINHDLDSPETTESGEKLPGREWDLARCVEMDIGLRADDACCFTIAFSPSSHLCAIGSQSGIVTVLDVWSIHNTAGDGEAETLILCQFPASRSSSEGGAVRCMTFSPEPWDLLVWLEGHGRAGIADVRQAFLRRQILHLDLDDPQLQEVHTEPMSDDSNDQRLDEDSLESTPPPRRGGVDSPTERGGREVESTALRESLIQGLTERERLIVDFLNTARWPVSPETRATERPERPLRATLLHPHAAARARHHGSRDAALRPSRPASPHREESSNTGRHPHSGRPGAIDPLERAHHPRRQSSVVLSQGNRSSEGGSSNQDRQPSLTLSYSTSPSELRSTSSDVTSRPADSDSTGHETGVTLESEERSAPVPALDFTFSPDALRLRAQRSSSTPRRTERSQSDAERRYDSSRLSHNEIRANVAAERLRRQRQIANEVHNRSFEREQRHRSNVLGLEQTHSPRWIRNIINDLPDRSLIHGPGAEEPDATAGVGWGADGRTLYIATLEGIFEFQLNVHDRKTFPIFSYR